MSRRDERAEVYERLAVAVAEQLAADGRLRAVLEAAVKRVAERERALDLLTPAEVAAGFRVPVKAVGALAREGLLPGRKVGRHWRFRRGDVAAFVLGGDATGCNGTIDGDGGQAG